MKHSLSNWHGLVAEARDRNETKSETEENRKIAEAERKREIEELD